MIEPIYASFYTPDYEGVARKLIESLEALHLPNHIEAMPDRGKWSFNCAMKAPFLKYVMDLNKGWPVVWVDADAIVHRRPVIFDNLTQSGTMDVGVCRWKRIHSMRSAEVLSGTVYLGATPGARELLDVWEQECKAYPLRWDQVSLSVSLLKCNLQIEWLPIEYTFIHDIHRWEYPDAKPYIEHFQHSRIRKAKEIAEGGTP